MVRVERLGGWNRRAGVGIRTENEMQNVNKRNTRNKQRRIVEEVIFETSMGIIVA